MGRWWELIQQVRAEAKANNLGLVAAGVAFYGMLAAFPAIIAVVTVYGLVADPAKIPEQLGNITDTLPQEARELLIDQLTANATADRSGLTLGLVISLGATVWAAGGGIRALLTGLNIIFAAVDKRGFVRRTSLAVGLTVGGIVAVIVALGLVAAFPAILRGIGLGPIAAGFAQLTRWVLLGALVAGGLSVLYRWGPARTDARWRWITVGSATAMALWLVGSVGFSLYVSNFGSYNKTYGSIAAVIVLMLWIFVSAYVILLGAQLDAVLEGQQSVTKPVPRKE